MAAEPMRGRRRAIKSVTRFVAHVLIVSGLLTLGDAGATLTWQEPVSAANAHHKQAKLQEALAKPPKRVIERRPLRGDAIGKIVIPRIDASDFVVEGTDADSLSRGPGHYPATPLPGQKGTVGIAGHRTTHGAPFRDVDKLRPHDLIRVEMPYGTFDYRVEKTKIVAPTEVSVTNPVGYNRLILSACHPKYSAAQRIIVFAKQSGRSAARVGSKHRS